MAATFTETRSTRRLRLAWILLGLLALTGYLMGIPLVVDSLSKGTLGMWYRYDGQTRMVVAVTPGLPAYEAGIRAGDQVLRIESFTAPQAGIVVDRSIVTYREPSGKVDQVNLIYTTPTHLPFDLDARTYAWLSVGLDLVFFIVFLLLGTVILWQAGVNPGKDTRRNNNFAFVVAFFLLVTAIRLPPEVSLLSSRVRVLTGFGQILGPIGFVIFPLLLALFPNGRWVPRWIWVYPLIGLGYTIFTLITGWNASITSSVLETVIELLIVGPGIAAQIYRYRNNASPQEKQQTKWAIYGIALSFVIYYLGQLVFQSGLFPLLFAGVSRSPAGSYLYLVFSRQYYLVLLTVPVTLAVSILRHRLWDIDLIIRRTLVYTLVTSVLAALYFLVVILLQSAFGVMSGEQSVLGIVLSTLIITLLFTPLRRRAQNIIDQRFYRSRYNTTQTIETFSARLRAEVDLDRLTSELVSAVDETMQPEHISLWIKPNKPPKSTTFPGNMAE